jgi:hypothetical protein
MHQISVAGLFLAIVSATCGAGRPARRDALDLGRGPLLGLLADLVHAVDALADELLVLPAVLEDVPQQPVDDRDVGAGPDADVVGGVGRGAGEARVDDDERRPVALLAAQHVLHRHRMRLGGIAADDHQALRVLDVVVAVGHRAVAPGVGYAGDGGRVADARLVVDVVGAPERGELAEEVGALVRELGRAEQEGGVRAGVLADLEQLVADLVDRLLPGEPLPLPVHELERVLQPPLAVDELPDRGALGAVRALVDRAVVAGLLADPDAVLHLGDDRAADRAVGADRLAYRDLSTGLHRACLGLADHRRRQRAERGQAARGEAGPLHEGAPVDRAGDGGGDRAGEPARLGRGDRRRCRRRAGAALDQHGGGLRPTGG